MTLTKKHFKAIAEILKNYFDNLAIVEQKDIDGIINSFCVYLKSENGLFDSEKFRIAILGDRALKYRYNTI